MADNVTITPGAGTTLAADELVDGTLGTVKVGFSKVMDGTLDSSNKWVISATGAGKVDGSGVTQPVSAASLPLPTGAATAAKQPALGTAGTPSADVITVQGVTSMTALKVDGSGVTQPVSGTVSITANSSVNQNQVGGTAIDTNSGNKSAGTQRVVLATDQPQLTNALKVDGSGVTQPVSGTVSANVKPATSGGLTIYRLLAAASTNSNLIKNAAGQVFGWYFFNAAASTRYVKLYNKATAPTVGTDTPVLTLPLPAGGAANVEFTNGIAFGTGIGIGITGALADNDTTAVTANDVVVNLFYA